MIDFRVAIVAALAMGAVIAVMHGRVLRAEAALDKGQASHAQQLQRISDKTATAAAAAVRSQQLLQRAVAAIDTERTKERDHATQENDRLRAAVRAGTVRLRIPAACPARSVDGGSVLSATPAAGVDAEAADLAPAAGQAVLDLRAALITERAQLLALQDYARTCSAGGAR